MNNPVIALVGRPNVGKSTLFNKLTRSQDALVADFPGLTRDRQYGDGKVGGFDYLVIDTGGLSGEPDTLDSAMAGQTMTAVREADLVVFLVDARDGLTAVDESIADVLRREASNVLLCVNKVDGIGDDQASLDFYALGFSDTTPIAAAHNRGVQSLMEDIATRLDITPDLDRGRRVRRRDRRRAAELAKEQDAAASATPAEDDGAATTEPEEQVRDIRIAFVGRPNVGKSTLVNRLIGEERVIAYDQPGTTRDSVAVPFTRAGKDYQLIDTAGVRRRGKVSQKVEKFSIIKTLQAIEQSNVCVMLIDGTEGLTDQDMHLLGHIIEKGRALIVAVNKWDALDSEAREELRETLRRRVEFLQFTRIHFISALRGSGVADLFKSINRAYASAFIDVPTPKLNRLLELAISQHAPPMANGRRIKLRYAHQGGMNPPIIVLHGNQTAKLPQSYQRYLTNYFIKALRLFGTPLRVELKQGSNPFADRRKRRIDKPREKSRGGAADGRTVGRRSTGR